MYKLGITGGIGSGKTLASEYLAQKSNVYVFNADRESKKCLKKSLSLQHKLINIFGQNIKGKNEKFDIKLLATFAFKNEINQQL